MTWHGAGCVGWCVLVVYLSVLVHALHPLIPPSPLTAQATAGQINAGLRAQQEEYRVPAVVEYIGVEAKVDDLSK